MLRKALWTGLYAGMGAAATVAARPHRLRRAQAHRRRTTHHEITATKADHTVERGSRRLHHLAQKAADRGGLAGKLAAPLEDDAQFLRKPKPSLIAQRIRAHAPSDEHPRPTHLQSRDGGSRPTATAIPDP